MFAPCPFKMPVFATLAIKRTATYLEPGKCPMPLIPRSSKPLRVQLSLEWQAAAWNGLLCDRWSILTLGKRQTVVPPVVFRRFVSQCALSCIASVWKKLQHFAISDGTSLESCSPLLLQECKKNFEGAANFYSVDDQPCCGPCAGVVEG